MEKTMDDADAILYPEPNWLVDKGGGYWAAGMSDVCQKCGATVENNRFLRQLHTQWHERLRRAVEEGAILGN